MALFQWRDPDDTTTWEARADRLREHPRRWGCWVGGGEPPVELVNKDFEWTVRGDAAAYHELYGRYVGKKMVKK